MDREDAACAMLYVPPQPTGEAAAATATATAARARSSCSSPSPMLQHGGEAVAEADMSSSAEALTAAAAAVSGVMYLTPTEVLERLACESYSLDPEMPRESLALVPDYIVLAFRQYRSGPALSAWQQQYHQEQLQRQQQEQRRRQREEEEVERERQWRRRQQQQLREEGEELCLRKSSTSCGGAGGGGSSRERQAIRVEVPEGDDWRGGAGLRRTSRTPKVRCWGWGGGDRVGGPQMEMLEEREL